MNVTTPTTVGSLPAVRLQAPDGAHATITLFGAHVVSWTDAGGSEQLFMSERSALDGLKAIRGGVPVIFPQFSQQGSGIRHGFARISHWRMIGSGIEDGAAFADFVLTRDDLSPEAIASWPHEAQLRLQVAVRAQELKLTLNVTNSGEDAFSFASALHTYFRVADVERARASGLQNLLCVDAAAPHAAPTPDASASISFAAPIDRIYQGVDKTITLDDGVSQRSLASQGFQNAVVWNPGAEGARALSDMADEEYRQFVCIEPALIGGHLLPPGASWRGVHLVRALAV